MLNPSRRQWLAPAGLVLLSLVPVVAGAVRLTDLSSGPVTPDNARFHSSPVPIVLHIIGVTVFSLLGAFQFVPSLRRRRWHRFAGRVVLPAGLIAALSGIWMTLTYALPASDGPLLEAERLVFGPAMALALVLALVAVRRRDYPRHRAWMLRGYAIGMGAGTQAFTVLPWILLAGEPGRFTYALLMGAGWLINLVAAEWLIRRRPARPARRAGPAPSAVIAPTGRVA